MSKLRESIVNLMEESGNRIRCRDEYLNYMKSLESGYTVIDNSRMGQSSHYDKNFDEYYFPTHKDEYNIYSKNPEENLSVTKFLQDLKRIYKRKGYEVTPITKNLYQDNAKEFTVYDPEEYDFKVCTVYACSTWKTDSKEIPSNGLGVCIEPVWYDEDPDELQHRKNYIEKYVKRNV